MNREHVTMKFHSMDVITLKTRMATLCENLHKCTGHSCFYDLNITRHGKKGNNFFSS